MKNKIRIILIIIIIFTLLINGCITIFDQDYVDHKYQLIVDGVINENFNIYIPLSDTNNLSSEEIKKYYRYENISKEYIMTHFFLRISIEEPLNITYNKRFKNMDEYNNYQKHFFAFDTEYKTIKNISNDDSISDINNGFSYVDIYTTLNKNISIQFKYYKYNYISGGQNSELLIEGNLVKGWNRIKILSGTNMT